MKPSSWAKRSHNILNLLLQLARRPSVPVRNNLSSSFSLRIFSTNCVFFSILFSFGNSSGRRIESGKTFVLRNLCHGMFLTHLNLFIFSLRFPDWFTRYLHYFSFPTDRPKGRNGSVCGQTQSQLPEQLVHPSHSNILTTHFVASNQRNYFLN